MRGACFREGLFLRFEPGKRDNGSQASSQFGDAVRTPCNQPAEPEIRNPKLEIRNKSELMGMGQWTNGRAHMSGEDQHIPKFHSLRSLRSLRLIASAVFRVNLNSAVDLTAKNAKIAKKDSYAWIY